MYGENSVIPLYHQIREKLTARIESGEFKPQEQIPSENELCEEYNVSRITIRRAIDEMVKLGLIVKKQGKGTFVNQPKINFFSVDLISLSERMRQQGLNVTTRVITVAEVLPSSRVKKALMLADKEPVVEIKRVRYIENDPITIETNFIQKDIFEGHMTPEQLKTYLDQGNSLYELINNRLGVKFTRAHQTFEPILLQEDEQKILDCGENPVGLLIYRTTYSEKAPVEYVKVVHRGDLCKFEMELKSD
jgi:GntR family transcriptional regulator